MVMGACFYLLEFSIEALKLEKIAWLGVVLVDVTIVVFLSPFLFIGRRHMYISTSYLSSSVAGARSLVSCPDEG